MARKQSLFEVSEEGHHRSLIPAPQELEGESAKAQGVWLWWMLKGHSNGGVTGHMIEKVIR